MSGPVPYTGKRRRYKVRNARTGTLTSKAVSHVYPDEWGGKGPHVRRQIRRIEARLWHAEAHELAPCETTRSQIRSTLSS